MSEYTPKDQWHNTIRQFDINEIVEGGETGLDNIPHQQLADNLLYLKNRMGQSTTPTPTPTPSPVGAFNIESYTPEPNWQNAERIFKITHSSGAMISDLKISCYQRNSTTGKESPEHTSPVLHTLPADSSILWRWALRYFISSYDEIVIKIAHDSMPEPYVQTLKVSEPAPWSITTSTPTPFAPGQEPIFSAVHQRMIGREIKWKIEDIHKSGTEGDQIIEVVRGKGIVNASGVLTIQSTALPDTSLSSSTSHVIKVTLLDDSNNSKEFTIN